MALANTKRSWGWLARLLHWAMAVLIVGMLCFGFWLVLAFNPGDPAKLDAVQLHKSFGFVVFALACLRLVWRAVNPVPAPPAGVSAPMHAAAQAGHLALYFLMIAMPVTGWLGASASPYNDVDAYPMQIRNMVFGLFEMPDPFPVGSHELSDAYMTAHGICAAALVVVLAGHVAASAWHGLMLRDGVFGRMWSGREGG